MCRELMEPELQKACRLIAERMKREDREHDWICMGVPNGADMTLIKEMSDFATNGSHKFVTFCQDDLVFAILGVRCSPREPEGILNS